jgi:hypothetical protein
MNETTVPVECLHLHLTRIANMDLGDFHSSPAKGVFRCEECKDLLVVENIRTYVIAVTFGTQ